MKTIELTNGTMLKDLVTLANQESELVLTQDHQPVAKMVAISQLHEAGKGKPVARILGLHRGAWVVAEDFDEPLPDEFWLGQIDSSQSVAFGG